MLRFLKAPPLTLAIAALTFLFTSCNSSNTQARFVNAISDTSDYGAAGLDIEANGTKEFTNVTFRGLQPTSGYTNVPSGSDTIEGFKTGGTTEVFSNSNVTLNSGTKYTMVATGFATGTGNVVIYPLADNNTAPANGMVNFRVINASPSGPSAVDVYIAPNPTGGNLGTKYFSGLAYNDPTAYTYINIPFNSSATPNYTVTVTVAGDQNPIFNQQVNAGGASEGAICTLVLTDIENGNPQGMNPNAVVLNDLNCAN